MNSKLAGAALAVIIVGRAAAQVPCSAAFQDSVSIRTIAAFERMAAVPPVWDDYQFSRHPLLLLADSSFQGGPDTPVCAAIWRSGRPLEPLELAARPRFSTPLYGMIATDSIGPRASAWASTLPLVAVRPALAVAAALRARGVTRAVVLNVPLRYPSLGALGEMLAKAKADPAPIHADLAVHETFHLHAQFPTWLDQPRSYAWPAWDVQPDRSEVSRRCYAGSAELTAALRAEVAALVAAYDMLTMEGGNPDTALARREARRFIELRASRRALQDTISVDQSGKRISCEEAEDLLELEEGTTQWIGHATSLRAGLTTARGLRGRYAGQQAEMFYQTGPLQLFILDGLLGHETLRAITSELARSASAEGINGSVHARFRHEVER